MIRLTKAEIASVVYSDDAVTAVEQIVTYRMAQAWGEGFRYAARAMRAGGFVSQSDNPYRGDTDD